MASALRTTAPRVLTEDLGKIFEMAICLLYETPYDGLYRYSMESAQQLKARVARLKDHFPACQHTAKGGGVYDFTAATPGGPAAHLSAKTTKKDGKIAPQLVGQAQPAAFCERLGLPPMESPALKIYIQEHIAEILPKLEENTFSCPTVYYNKKTNRLAYIVRKEPILWAAQSFSWTRAAADWTNSSTLKVNGTSILEIQFHTASRTNMAVRWCFEKLLATFAGNFEIHEL
jgi:hypothetical protein